MQRAVSKVLALFPMEPPLYQKEGIPVAYVGHPMADTITTDRLAVRERLGLPTAVPIFALPAGFAPVRTAVHGRHLRPDGQAHPGAAPAPGDLRRPLATRETRLMFEQAIYDQGAADVPFRLLFGHARDALGAADVSSSRAAPRPSKRPSSSGPWSSPTRWPGVPTG